MRPLSCRRRTSTWGTGSKASRSILVEVGEAQLGARGHAANARRPGRRCAAWWPRAARRRPRACRRELGLAADRRDRAGVQDRAVGRQALERGVGVPRPTAELVEPAGGRRRSRILSSASRLPTSARFSCRRSVWSLRDREDSWSRAGRSGAQSRVGSRRSKVLVGEHQDGVLGEGCTGWRRRSAAASGWPSIDIAHLGGESRA